MSDKLYVAYMIILSIATLLSIIRFPKTDKGTRFISGFICLGLLTEIIARYAAIKYRNNLPVHNISSIIEFILISLYFNYSISYFKRYHIGIIIALIGIVAGITTLIVFDCFYKTNSNFLFLECLAIICMSLYAIFKLLLLNNEKLQLHQKVQFWIPLILVIYQTGALWSWLMYEYYRIKGESSTTFLHHTLISNSIVTYLSFAILFLLYPKMKNAYA